MLLLRHQVLHWLQTCPCEPQSGAWCCCCATKCSTGCRLVPVSLRVVPGAVAAPPSAPLAADLSLWASEWRLVLLLRHQVLHWLQTCPCEPQSGAWCCCCATKCPTGCRLVPVSLRVAPGAVAAPPSAPLDADLSL